MENNTKTRIIDKFAVAANRKNTDEAWRNYSHLLVTAFGDLLVQEGCDSDDVENTYCEQRARSLDQETIEGLIYTLPPAFLSFRDEHLVGPEVHWGASRNTPFILLGHVGTGKSTFLDYTFLHKIPKENPNTKAVIVNFMRSEDNHDDFSRYLLVRINSELARIDSELAIMNYELMEKLFAEEIASYKTTLRSSADQERKISELFSNYVDAHLPEKDALFKDLIRRKIKYLRKKGMSIWLILDNIDQHHSCLQNDALVSAVSTAATFKCSLVIAMRYISLATPAAKNTYASYRPRKLKLSFPDVSVLLKKRLTYLERLAKPILDNSLKWTGHTLVVGDLLDDIRRTIGLVVEPEFMGRYLLPLANYNMRRLLEMILSTFQSYFFFYDRFNNKRYVPNKTIFRKRFIQAHLLKNQDYFGNERDEKESFILNLFENENKSFDYNQTIRIRLLQALENAGSSPTLAELTGLILATFNYEELDLLNAYRAFLKLELFAIRGDLGINQADNIFHDGFAREHMRADVHVSITYAGRFHVGVWKMLEYIEIMKLSTYVPSDMYLPIQSEKVNATVADRAASTKRFVKYIIAEEKRELAEAVKDTESFSKFFGLIGPELQHAVDTGIAEVERIAS